MSNERPPEDKTLEQKVETGEVSFEDFAEGKVKPPLWNPRVISGGGNTPPAGCAFDADGNLVNAEVAEAEARAVAAADAVTKPIVADLDWMSPLHYRPDEQLDPAYERHYSEIKAPQRLFDLKLESNSWPQTGFLKRYMEVMTPTTDAPLPFHLATALVALATAMGPRWTIEHQSGGLTPNLWFLLVADSGSRKSTAMKPVLKFFSPTTCWNGGLESTKKFMQDLTDAKDHNALWFFDEAAAFFTMINKTFANDLAPRLTAAYNGDTVSYGSSKVFMNVIKPHLSMLMGTPLAWLRSKLITPDVLRGGVFGRFLLIPASRDEPLLHPPCVDPVAFENLHRWLDMIANAPGHSFHNTLSHGAKHTLFAWLKAAQEPEEELALAGVWNRRGDFALKLALLYHVATLRQPNQAIQEDSMQQAINFLHNYVLPGQLWAISRLSVDNPIKRVQLDIEEALDARPEGLNYAIIPALFGLPVEQAQRILYSLWTAHKIMFWRHRDPYIRYGRPHYLCTRPGLPPPQVGGILDPQEKCSLPPALLKLREMLGDADNADDMAPVLRPGEAGTVATAPDEPLAIFDDGASDEKKKS